MKKTTESLDHLIELANRALAAEPPPLRPGFASRVARTSLEARRRSAGAAEAFEPAFRWAIVAFAALTIVVAAVNAPSVAIASFDHDAAYESHLLDLVSLRNE